MYKIAVLDDDIRWGLAIQRFFRNEFSVSVFTEPEPFFVQVHEYQLVIVDFFLASTRDSEREIDGYGVIYRLKSTLANPPLCLLVSGCLGRHDLEVIRDRPYCMADDVASKDSGLDVILEKTKRLLQMPTPSPSFQVPR